MQHRWKVCQHRVHECRLHCEKASQLASAAVLCSFSSAQTCGTHLEGTARQRETEPPVKCGAGILGCSLMPSLSCCCCHRRRGGAHAAWARCNAAGSRVVEQVGSRKLECWHSRPCSYWITQQDRYDTAAHPSGPHLKRHARQLRVGGGGTSPRAPGSAATHGRYLMADEAIIGAKAPLQGVCCKISRGSGRELAKEEAMEVSLGFSITDDRLQQRDG